MYASITKDECYAWFHLYWFHRAVKYKQKNQNEYIPSLKQGNWLLFDVTLSFVNTYICKMNAKLYIPFQ